MSEMVQDTAWQADALELRATTGLTPAEIGNRVDKHPATIRKLFARNPAPESTVDRAMTAEEASAAFDGQIPGQTTVDDHLSDVPPEDDPEYEAENPEKVDAALTVLIREAGEATGPLQTRPGEEYPDPLDVEPLPPAPVIKGTVQLALDFGPNAAPVTCATITFKSEKLSSGYFELGDVVSGRFTARITGVAGAEKLDRDLEDWVAKPQAQTATITEITID